MSEISLTASMRSNLLSLQQIAKLQDSTQLRLSTGLKVNSAIDNPSSYYTASSLNNRAEDLSALLDSMGQSVQTIKAATEGIEKAEDLLSQMKAIAEQVNTGVYVPEKSYFEKLVGSNGAVVSTAEELRAAVDSGKNEICVYGKIDLGDISTSGGLSLQENQKLVGVNYYGNFGTEGEEFSSISATSSAANNMIDIKKTGSLVSDLNLNYKNTNETGSCHVISITGTDVVADVQNVSIKAEFSNNNNSGKAGIYMSSKTTLNISERFNIDMSGTYAFGLALGATANATIASQALVNIKTSGQNGNAIDMNNRSNLTIASEAKVNIETLGEDGNGINLDNSSNLRLESKAKLQIATTGRSAIGISAYHNSNVDIASGSDLFIKTSGESGSYGFSIFINSTANLAGNIKIDTEKDHGILLSDSSGNKMTVTSSAQIYLSGQADFYIGANTGGYAPNLFTIEQGAKIAYEKDGATKWYEIQADYEEENATQSIHYITADNVENTLNVGQTSSWQTPSEIVDEEKAKQEAKEAEEQVNREVYQTQYNNALSQYDSLIKDSSYKGINLLQADDLKVIFNENRSSTLEVSGVDLSSDKIGMMTADWTKAKDVQNSINQVIEAKNTLRSASTKLGNYYSIITERETFTDNLINVLEEGADKLTLADMNEESANMLSLQTRQQLAINSLSLASQSGRAVLRLF